MIESNGHSNKRLGTGVRGLDEILLGGFTPNHLYLIEGDPGSGKTTLALQFLLEGIRQGEKCLYVTLSESKNELFNVADTHGWSMEGLNIFELIPDQLKYADGEEQYTFFHPSEVELGETMKAILEKVEKVQPNRVVFDSLSEMRLLARDPLRYRRQILGLKQYFTGRQSTVLLLDDRSSALDDLDLQSLAHGVVFLEQLAPQFGAERRRLRVIKFRGSAYRGGFHDFTIHTGGLAVFPRLVANEHHADFEKVDTLSGVSALDTLLGGGIPRGSSTLLMGPAGSGKSSIAIQYAIAAMNRGEVAALFTFEEGTGSLYSRTLGLGIDLRAYEKKGLLKIAQVDPAELSPGEFAARVQERVEKDRAGVVVLDSLNGYLNAMPEEKFLIIQLHELLSSLNQQGVVTMLISAQHGILGTAMTSAVDTSYLTDNVILFRFYEYEGHVRKAVSVVKKRSGSHESTIRNLNMSSEGITVGPPLTNMRGVLSGVPVERMERETQ